MNTHWQPIETAPQNGNSILVYANCNMYVVRWIDPDEPDIDLQSVSEYAWWHVDDNKHGPYPLRGPSPTHWLPLPEPPATQTNHQELAP